MRPALLLLALTTGCAAQYGGRATVLEHMNAQLAPSTWGGTSSSSGCGSPTRSSPATGSAR